MTRLTQEEKKIEKALVQGEYIDVGKGEFDEIAKSLATRKKDAILTIRVNSADLKKIKHKAKKHGIHYQSLISEWLHHAVS